MALLGLALWNESKYKIFDVQTIREFHPHSDIPSISADLASIVNRNRSAILAELHKLYAKTGLSDYAARLGELLCLLVNVEVSAVAY